jgi:hypothetical protein
MTPLVRSAVLGCFAVVLFTGIGLASVALMTPKAAVPVAQQDLPPAPPLAAQVQQQQTVGFYHEDAEMQYPIQIEPGASHYFRCPAGGSVQNIISPGNGQYWGYVFSGQEAVNSLTGRNIWDGPWFASDALQAVQDMSGYTLTNEIPPSTWIFVQANEPVVINCGVGTATDPMTGDEMMVR